MKKILTFVLAVLMLLSFTGCTPPAGSVNTELFVVASHSLLGVLGRELEGVFILEEDDFGRVMFAYLGHTVTSDRTIVAFNILAVAIAQRTTRQYSYFYDGVNVIFCEVELQRIDHRLPQAVQFLSEEFVMEHFTEEQLEQLKGANSWNEELNEDQFFRVRATRGDKRRHLTRVSEDAQRAAFPSITDIRPRYRIPLTMDRKGNILYLMKDLDWGSFLIMFDSDGELIEGTGVMELDDLWDYHDQLREFKELNGWSFYYR